jgi:hypothetical protein
MPEQEPPATAFLLKRGTLIGAALGMLAGLILLGIRGVTAESEIASIILWRNCILAGALAGFLCGGVFAYRHRKPKTEN